MKLIIGLPLAAIFGFLSGLHFYWGIAGKSVGNKVVPGDASGKLLFNPSRLDSFIVAIGLAGLAIYVLILSDIIILVLPHWIRAYGLWFIAILFFIRAIGDFKYLGFFKKIKGSEFAKMDTRYFSPLCLLISILSLLLHFIQT